MNKVLFLVVLIISQMAFSSPYANLLYQESDDVVSALKFIGTPEEKLELYKDRVRGDLASQDLIAFANRIIKARETRDTALFKNSIDPESVEKSKEIFDRSIDKINDGSLLYGNKGFKYFVTSEPIAERHLNRLFKTITQKPSVTLYFYHYHSSKDRLIASSFYLKKVNNEFITVLPVL